MTLGRPNKGVEHVTKLEGGEQEKGRLRAILSTFTGEMTVAEASAELGISETRFALLREKALQSALSSLAPRPVGRPPRKNEEKPATDLQATLVEMTKRLDEAKKQRDALQELFNVGLSKPGDSREKKGGKNRKGRKKKANKKR